MKSMERHKMSSINVDRIPFARKKNESHGSACDKNKRRNLKFLKDDEFLGI